MKEITRVPFTADYLLRNNFKVEETFKSFSSPRYSIQINSYDWLYFRPCYLGGFYWGMTKIDNGKVIEFEVYDCPNFLFVDQFTDLFLLLTGKTFTSFQEKIINLTK